MMPVVNLPTAEGRLEPYRLREPRAWNGTGGHGFDRIGLAAAHIVADPLADVDPWVTPAIDWDATIAYRRHLWALGLGVAEAMDTAQRGMGLDWTNALQLIRLSVEAARDLPGAVVFSGVGTDQLFFGVVTFLQFGEDGVAEFLPAQRLGLDAFRQNVDAEAGE